MSPLVCTLASLALVLLAGCVGTAVPTALVLQFSHITRARVTERAQERRREIAFTASLSVGLEATAPAVIEPHALDPPSMLLDAVSCEPAESAICAWAHAAEDSAWLAARERVEQPP
jgi:hypothetical protein